jgi:hypothetical protein
MAKTVKPRTNLLLDMGLFSLAVIHLTAAATVNIILHDENSAAYLSWHRVLGVTGVMLALVVTTHLLFHLPWIRVQLRQVVHTGSRKRTVPGPRRG